MVGMKSCRHNLQRRQCDLLRQAQGCVERMEKLRAKHPRARAAAGVDSRGGLPEVATWAQARAMPRLEKLEADHSDLLDEKRRTMEDLATATQTLRDVEELLVLARGARRNTE